MKAPAPHRRSLAEFAARRRQKSEIIFSGDMCGRENTAQAASVEFVCHRRTNSARSRLQAFCRKTPMGFSDRQKNREPLRLPVSALVREICHQLLRRERAEGFRVLCRPAHGGVHIGNRHAVRPGDGLERAACQLLRGRSGHLLLPFLRLAASMSRRPRPNPLTSRVRVPAL